MRFRSNNVQQGEQANRALRTVLDVCEGKAGREQKG